MWLRSLIMRRSAAGPSREQVPRCSPWYWKNCSRDLAWIGWSIWQQMPESMLLSVDVGHAYHPNYGDKMDPTNQSPLNTGFCIKEASSQSYATDCRAVAIVEQICRQEEILIRNSLTGLTEPAEALWDPLHPAFFRFPQWMWACRYLPAFVPGTHGCEGYPSAG